MKRITVICRNKDTYWKWKRKTYIVDSIETFINNYCGDYEIVKIEEIINERNNF